MPGYWLIPPVDEQSFDAAVVEFLHLYHFLEFYLKKRNKNEENSNMRENANLGKCPVGGLHVRKENPLFSFLFLQFCVRKSARSFFLFLVIMPNERKE